MDMIRRADGQIWYWVTLAPDVIAVARINEGIGDWAAYIGACPPYEWAANVERIAAEGQKQPATVAAALFNLESVTSLQYRD